MSNSITLPASMQPPTPPPNALDTTPGSNPNEPVVHYQLSSGHIASLPQSSVPALVKQDPNAKQIPSPEQGQVLVQLSSGHAATVPSTSIHALKQQDPNFKYVAGDLNSPDVASHQDLLGAVQAAVAGSNTALATPASPEWTQEGSGVSDILHGNIGQGAGKIWEAEKPHVIKGSLIEKAIQKLDPAFQGDVTNDQVAAHAAAYNATERPAVDVAQFIDKSKSPVKKAIAETAQSFTSPANVATLYATGGLGLVDSPAALSMASRLISGGFSAAAIGQAYQNLKGFKAAYDAGDENEAIYQLTHAVTSGLLGVLAARGAVKDTNIDPVRLVNPFRKAAQATGDFGKQVVQGQTVAQAPAQEALRTAAQAVTPATSTVPTSLRTALEQPIASVFANAKGLYRAVDQASGVDFKDLNDKLENAEYQIGQSADGSPEEAKWEQARTNIMDKIADAKQKALNAGVDPQTLDQADAEFTRARALQDLQTKVFKNPNIVEGNSAQGTDETINIDAAIKAIQRLQDTTKYGAPRLEQALGKDAANAFLESLYDAQRTGAKAISRQQLLGTVWKVAKGVGSAGLVLTGGFELLKHLFGGD
jgi:hypothetical protein